MRSETFWITTNEYHKIIEYCICYEKLDTKHLYACESLNDNTISIEYDKIYDSKIKPMKTIVDRIRQSYQKLQIHAKEQDQKSTV